MDKHIPFGVFAVAFAAFAGSAFYTLAAARHLQVLWLVPVSLTFTAIGLLAVAVAIKLREFGARLAALETGLKDQAVERG